MIRDFAVADTESLRLRAEAWIAEPGTAPEVRQAATVMFVRDAAAAGLEVFMLRRVASMVFAPSMMVFPGGGVDPRDAAPDLPWAGPSPAAWARQLKTDEESARVLLAAAVREVFEECGVLLAGPDGDTVLSDVGDEHWHGQREALLGREISMAQMLLAHHLVLRSDLLSYRAHWITPEFEPRRYDTRFFAAAMPAGQSPDDRTTEADLADWVRPGELLGRWRRGHVLMLPPTVVCLEEIAAATCVADFIAERPPVAPVSPVLTETPHGLVMRAELPR